MGERGVREGPPAPPGGAPPQSMEGASMRGGKASPPSAQLAALTPQAGSGVAFPRAEAAPCPPDVEPLRGCWLSVPTILSVHSPSRRQQAAGTKITPVVP